MAEEGGLPASVVAGLEGVAGEGQVSLVVTVGEDGWPHLSQLSQAQILVLDPRRIRFALWATSSATANLRRSGRMSLFRVDDGVASTTQIDCVEAGSLGVLGTIELTRFEGRVRAVRADTVPYAELTSVLEFRLYRPDDVLPVWAAIQERLAREPAE